MATVYVPNICFAQKSFTVMFRVKRLHLGKFRWGVFLMLNYMVTLPCLLQNMCVFLMWQGLLKKASFPERVIGFIQLVEEAC